MLTWLRRFYWKLAPLESLALDATQKVLLPEMTRIFDLQVSRIKRVRRFRVQAFLQSVDCEPEDPGNAPLFPCKGNIELATIEVQHLKGWGTHIVRVLATEGRIRDIVIRPAPGSARWDDGWIVVSVTAGDDPSRDWPSSLVSVHPLPCEPARSLSGWVAEFLSLLHADHVMQPVSEQVRARFRSRVHATLPNDYLEFADQVGKAKLQDDASIWGVEGIWEVHLDDADYYLLGMIVDVGWFSVRRKDQSGDVYFLDFDGEAAKNCGSSFRKAVEERLVDQYTL